MEQKSRNYNEGFGPAHLKTTYPVLIAEDNLVCAVCSEQLDKVEWIAVSTPKHKGVIIFACNEHIGPAMNLLRRMFPELDEVPNTIKFPTVDEN